MNVIIIEDETRSSAELYRLITAVDPDIKIIVCLESVEQTMTWLTTNPQPDLIFSDIQLNDGLSFEIYEQLSITCPIIFCTAFDEYLMDAFETNAISYLLKPITKEKVESALNKLKTLKSNFEREQSSLSIQNLIKYFRQP